jgi:hypothetical protein
MTVSVSVGAAAKLIRAMEHLDSLKEELSTFRFQEEAFKISGVVDEEACVFTIKVEPKWPNVTLAHWAVIVGEVVHNLRSALDYLVCESMRVSGVGPGRHNAFPILSTEPEPGFRAWATAGPRRGRRPGKLFGLSSEGVDLVESVQPFKGTEASLRLAQLDRLWQMDKHKTLIPVILTGRPPDLVAEDCVIVSRTEEMQGRTLVLTVAVDPTGPQPRIHAFAHAPSELAFGGRLLFSDLLNVVKVVVQLLVSFEALFAGEEHGREVERLRAKLGDLVVEPAHPIELVDLRVPGSTWSESAASR